MPSHRDSKYNQDPALEIDLSLGLFSYLASGLLYLFLIAVYFVSTRRGKISKSFVLLLATTLVWSCILSLSQIGTSIPFSIVTAAELARYFSWFYILHTASGYYLDGNRGFSLSNPLTPRNMAVLFGLAFVMLVTNDYWVVLFDLDFPVIIQVGWMFTIAVLGLLLVEQVIRNTDEAGRRAIILLCISAGSIFVYDFFVFSNALLVHSIDYEFWSARGIVNIVVAPTLVLAAVRNPEMAPDLHISRKFVFHSTTLLAAGAYLLFMSVIGFYVRESSGEWGKLIQAVFFVGASLLLAVVFFTPGIKIRLKRYLSYSFRNKYDYRGEWNRFAQTLLIPDPDISIYQRAIQAAGQIVDSQGGSLWTKEAGKYMFKAGWKVNPKQNMAISESSAVVKFLLKQQEPFSGKRLLTLDGIDFAHDHSLEHIVQSWLVLPLWINEELFGFICLQAPIVEVDLDIEDVDLLNTVAHHVSLALFLKEADTQLQQAQRFKELNQMTAFLVHDLKTVFGQLSLLVENANSHKQNPAFVDDMIDTVTHATQKMERLVEQLREPEREITVLKFPLLPVIEEIASSYHQSPAKLLVSCQLPENLQIRADRPQLVAALKHIVQNGIDSVGKDGCVEIVATCAGDHSIDILIKDNGSGMPPEFIGDGLFKPFQSTKGVSGMGVGAYQSRESIRSIGGEIDVVSELGVGTQFTIRLPVEYE